VLFGRGYIVPIVNQLGWSLLYNTESRETGILMLELLKRRLNRHFRSLPLHTSMRVSLYDHECTAEEVAKAYGAKKYLKFVKVVQETRLKSVSAASIDV